MQKMRSIRFFIISCIVLFSHTALSYAQTATLTTHTEYIYEVKVEEVLSKELREIPNSKQKEEYQKIQGVYVGGQFSGEAVVIDDDFTHSKRGDTVFVKYVQDTDGSVYVTVVEPKRTLPLILISVLLMILVLLFGGKQGAFSILTLGVSFLIIMKVLVPALLSGKNVLLSCVSVSLFALFVVMYGTHGFKRMTSAAFLGSLVSVVITSLLAFFFVYFSKLTGFSSDESMYLQINSAGLINAKDLLIGAIIIGIVGAVNDVAITQSAVVMELHATKTLSKKEIYKRAMSVGRDHTGSLINTLVLAYIGASLPLVLLLSYSASYPSSYIVSMEMIATEIVRIIIGAIGLVLAVPLSTIFAILLAKGDTKATTHYHTHHH